MVAMVADQLKQGLTPRQVALAVSLGAWMGFFPALGATTGLCLLAGWLLRLNQPALQAVNLLVYPLQLILLLPFFDLGARAFGGPPFTLSLPQLLDGLRAAPWAIVRRYWWVAVHAWAVWAALGLVLVPLLWWALTLAFTRLAAARRPGLESQARL
jgi:uncharacterized protein (DUF2062 family)